MYGSAAAASAAAGAFFAPSAIARTPTEIGWEDLIPPGIPYPEIIGEGEIDFVNDTWNPVFDANATKLNDDLDGTFIRMPGYILPLEVNADGVREFLLVPYVGACVHVPPPPPNQLVLVNAEEPWPGDQLWEAIWVEGTLKTELQTTDLAESAYTLTATDMERYIWD